ncbi:MAG TPA: AsmA-like C-terminal region-containing protein [Opitutaceae bacterium]|nr:AsmA-like C-terminal region-containing protein [Opitutaceae bacterium]
MSDLSIKRCFKLGWLGACLCTRCLATVGLWTFWLVLSLLLIVQGIIIVKKELSLPAWVRNKIETKLAESGLRATLGPTQFDTSGKILIQDLTVFQTTLADPLAHIGSVYAQLDPWWLLAGHVELEEIVVEDLTLFLPGFLSPTGQRERLFTELSFKVIPDGRTLYLPAFIGRFANLEVSLQGAVRLPFPPVGQEPADVRQQLRLGIQSYLKFARNAFVAIPHLQRVQQPRLHLDLIPRDRFWAEVGVTFSAQQATFPASLATSLGGDFVLSDIVMRTRLPLQPSRTASLAADVLVSRVEAPQGRKLEKVRASLLARWELQPFNVVPTHLKLSAAEFESPPWNLSSLTLETSWPVVNPTLGFFFAGEPWTVAARDLDLAQRKGVVSVKGSPTQELIQRISQASNRPLSDQLQLESKPMLEAEVHLAPGWKLDRAEGRLSVDAVTARTVPLDGASATFSVSGSTVEFKDIVLKQGASVAAGSYRMDTQTKDFRFILDGRLQPVGIQGWFKEWWSRFWENFDFSRSTPTASVDVRGRWGDPDGISVFVAVQNEATSIRGTAFDRARTRLFVRPHFYDALHYHVVQGERYSRGTFARQIDIESKQWSAMEFDAFSNLDLAEGARVLGIQGLGIVEPFTFDVPPQLRLTGRLEGPGSSQGQHRTINLAAYSVGPASYYEFPLHDLSVIGTIKDDDIVLDPLTTGFAQGIAEGRVHLTGEGKSRRLGFDFRLTRAVLGEAIRTLEEYGAKSKKVAMPAQSRFQERIAAGRLDLAVSADGMFEDLYSYRGQGNAELTGADLAEVHLFGLFSQSLRKTLFNFSTLKLDTVQANFSVEGPQLSFSEVRITGPRAAVEAKGDYDLRRKTLDMKAKLFPFKESSSTLSNAVGFVLTPFSQALEFKLTGPIDKPDWVFVYGPSNFFRTLMGETENSSVPANKAK